VQDPERARAFVQEPITGSLTDASARGAVRRRLHNRYAFRHEYEPHGRFGREQAVDGRNCGLCDLSMTGRSDELYPRPAQRTFARGDARLLAHEAGHSRNDEQEENRGGDDENE
jgi:hypothetical protein